MDAIETPEMSADRAIGKANVPLDDVGPSIEADPFAPTADGNPTELPEEFKPYSDINWEAIPEESRQEVLSGLKKFHGGLTQSQQRLADLEGALPNLQKKADALDWAWEQKWFQDGYNGTLSQPSGTAGPVAKSELSEHVDSDTAAAIQTEIQSAVQKTLEPILGQIRGVEQRVTSYDVDRTIASLRDEASKKGWPSPDTKVNEITQLMQSGRAGDIESAYRQAIVTDVQSTAAAKAIEDYKKDLANRAATTLPPGGGPSGVQVTGTFKGANCVEDAVAASLRELQMSR